MPAHETGELKGLEAIESRVERALAPLVLGIPLAYLGTYRSWQPDLLIYSYRLLGVLLAYGVFFTLVLASYRWSVPLMLTRSRRLVVFAGFAVIVWLVGSEVLLRNVSDYPRHERVPMRNLVADDEVGYRLPANHEQVVVGMEWTAVVRTNDRGLRADRSYGPKPEGVSRVIALGDSFTFSGGTSFLEAWPAVLERLLNSDGNSAGAFEVVNTGHPGWGTVQQATWFAREGFSLRPDLVLVAMTPNDLTDNRFDPPGAFTVKDGLLVNRFFEAGPGPEYQRHREKWYSLPGYVERSELLRRLRLLFRSAPPRGAAWQVTLDSDAQLLHARTEQSLLSLRDTAAAVGAHLGIVLITFREQLVPMAEGHDPEAFGDRWTSWGAEHGIPVVDTYPAVRNLPDPTSVYGRWDHHHNAAGNRLVAEAAAGLVRRMMP